MNFRRTMILVFLLCIMTFSISACGPNQISTEAPKEMVAVAVEKLKAAKSLSSTMTFDAKTITGEQTSEEMKKINADIIYEPLSLKTLEVRESESQSPMEIKTYVQEENGILVSYETYGNQWIKQTVDRDSLMSSIRMYDTKANAIMFLEKASAIKEISRENKEVVLEISIPEKDFWAVAESTQIFRMPGLSGLPSEYFKDIGDLTVSFVIDELSGMPKSYNLDLSYPAQTLINNVNHYLAGASEEGSAVTVPPITVEHFIINVQVESIDKTEKINIPKEVLEAATDVAEQMKMNEQGAAEAVESTSLLQVEAPSGEAEETAISE